MIPEHAVVDSEIRIVEYFADNGELQFVVTHKGDATLSSMLGLLRLAEHALIRDSESWGTEE